jgi:ATP-dependent DNA helicase RecG
MRLSDAELDQLLKDLESDRVERKESWKGNVPEKDRQAVCAFANDLPDHRLPGVLIVGARDDGSPSGLEVTDELLQTLADIKTDGKILPSPTLTVEKRRLGPADFAIVTVQPSNAPPVRYDGKIWIRIGSRRGIASHQNELILNERRKFRDIPFDAHPIPTAKLRDIDLRLFQDEYLPNAFARSVLDANERTVEERLASLKMIAAPDDTTPTVLGLLVLGKTTRDWIPGAYVQFLRIDGTDLSDPITDEAVIDGPLAQLLSRLDDKLEAHNRRSVDLTSESREKRGSPYPRAALQQLTRNAIMHRSHEGTNAPVRVTWFSDRIEILSPGGPYGSVTPENFGRPGLTDYRNPHLAEAMKVLGFVQRFGVGIATARKELDRNGNPPPEFAVDPSFVLWKVGARK